MKNTFKIMAVGSLLAVGSTQAATQVIISSFTGTSGDPSSVYEAANWSPTGVPGENPSSGEYYVAIVDNQFSTTGSVGGGSVFKPDSFVVNGSHTAQWARDVEIQVGSTGSFTLTGGGSPLVSSSVDLVVGATFTFTNKDLNEFISQYMADFTVGGEAIVIGTDPLNREIGDNLVITENNGSKQDGITVTAVPEPSSVALLGLGGLALILRRRK